MNYSLLIGYYLALSQKTLYLSPFDNAVVYHIFWDVRTIIDCPVDFHVLMNNIQIRPFTLWYDSRGKSLDRAQTTCTNHSSPRKEAKTLFLKAHFIIVIKTPNKSTPDGSKLFQNFFLSSQFFPVNGIMCNLCSFVLI